MDKNIDAAVKWLCESDILNKDNGKASFGGINNGYLWRDKKYQYVYNEITGYAINSFMTIAKWLGRENYLQHAINAADYLIRHQGPDDVQMAYGAVSHSLSLPELKNTTNYYSFDNAVILHGMINLYLRTGDKKYRDASFMIATWLLSMQKADGSFYSFYDTQRNVIEHPYDEFFFDSGCLHVKNAIGLMYMNHISDNRQYYNAALKLCNWGERLLDKDGLFWANTRKKYVFTHAHCYATEGYLHAFHLSSKQEYLAIARQAGDALLRLQNRDGSLYRIYKNKLSMRRWLGKKYRLSFKQWRSERRSPWKTVDATAQSARIWALLYSLTGKKTYLDASKKALDFISHHQVTDSDDQNMYGGFYYQLCDTHPEKMVILNGGMYTWCTQFGLSAHMMVRSAGNKTAFQDLVAMLF